MVRKIAKYSKEKKTYYYGKDHPRFKKARNEALLKDHYPNWPATGTIGMGIIELCYKYKISYARVYQIIRRAKEDAEIYKPVSRGIKKKDGGLK